MLLFSVGRVYINIHKKIHRSCIFSVLYGIACRDQIGIAIGLGAPAGCVIPQLWNQGNKFYVVDLCVKAL